MEQQAQEKKKTKHGFDRRKFWRGFSTVCLILAMALCVVVVSQVLSQGYVSIGGYSMFRVVTPSMEPTLPVGALLLSEEVSTLRSLLHIISNPRQDIPLLAVLASPVFGFTADRLVEMVPDTLDKISAFIDSRTQK